LHEGNGLVDWRQDSTRLLIRADPGMNSHLNDRPKDSGVEVLQLMNPLSQVIQSFLTVFGPMVPSIHVPESDLGFNVDGSSAD
jgi:hypothetical protein